MTPTIDTAPIHEQRSNRNSNAKKKSAEYCSIAIDNMKGKTPGCQGVSRLGAAQDESLRGFRAGVERYAGRVRGYRMQC